MAANTETWRLVACLRFGVLGIALVSPNDVLEVRRRSVCHRPSGQSLRSFLLEPVLDMMSDYGVTSVVVETDSVLLRWLKVKKVTAHCLTISEVKSILLPRTANPTIPHLYSHLVTRFPKLKNVCTVLPATGRVAMSRRWQTTVLRAVAFGLAGVYRL